MEALFIIQQELNAPKGQYNSFGKYKYRSCEDILAAVKPLLNKTKTTLCLSDELVAVGNRIYVKATATISGEDGKSESATAYAREDEVKKGMDGSQITGTASSYARKYALNGLFAIDDTKDADATNTHGQDSAGCAAVNAASQLQQAIAEMNAAATEQDYRQVWSKWSKECPAICANGTEFYKAACTKWQSLSQTAAQQ